MRNTLRYALLVMTLTLGACSGDSPFNPSDGSKGKVILTASMEGLPSVVKDYIRANARVNPDTTTRSWPIGIPIPTYVDPRWPREQVDSALAAWTSETEGRLIFRLVGTESEAHLKVLSRFPIPGLSPAGCGTGQPVAFSGPVITDGLVLLAVGLKEGCSEQWNTLSIAHEVGHALGFYVHTPADWNDFMAERPTGVITFSPMLKLAVNWWLSVPPGSRPVD